MGHQHEGRALLARELEHQLEHAVGGGAVQVAGRLVGQHAGRPRHQRARDRHPLALAARELGRAVQQALAQADPIEPMRGLGGGGLARQAPDPERHRHIVLRAELGQQMVELVDETQVAVARLALLRRAQAGQILAIKQDPAGAGRVEPAEQMQQRALARARTADDGQGLAGPDVEVNTLQHGHVEPTFMEALAQAACAQDDVGFTHSAAPRPG
jgi:hypothetical protein